ncbi:MAG: pilus (MSHA type) biogenesis protein MshL [Sulfuricella sp.]|nr:pilus (MSHA type) biogenesis protein MshL [Sulfuricella sp.]
MIQLQNWARNRVWLTLAVASASLLFGCANPPVKGDYGETHKRISDELKQAAQPAKPDQPDAVKNALLPPLRIEMPKASGKSQEPRFDLVVNNAPAAQVFMGIVSGTRYSMLMSPDLTGVISVNLKDVTVFEALDAIREINGYEYKVDGTRIYIQPQTIQTRVFKVNYLVGSRTGATNIRVAAGSTGTTGTTGGTPTPGGTGGATAGSSGGGSTSIATASSSDFWKELTKSLEAIVGNREGRSVVVSPQSGVIVVRATPIELRNIATFLSASQLSVERQVILEAKILEITLSDGYQTGINWAAFKSGSNSRLSIGVPGDASVGSAGDLTSSLITATPGANLKGTGGLFGLAFQTGSFASMLAFLESQGNVQVLSSPRIATLNNQKAVLKVGNEDYYVTSATSTTTTGTATTTTPSVNLQQFFSGIVLDVTPQIDERNNIILHIHPSVTRVSETNKVINMGGTTGTLTLPVASTSVSETDSIVRAHDGQIVAIGGLMKQTSQSDFSGMPGLKDIPAVGNAFGQTKRASTKTELVILLKPTVVQDESDWTRDILDTSQRVQAMSGRE